MLRYCQLRMLALNIGALAILCANVGDFWKSLRLAYVSDLFAGGGVGGLLFFNASSIRAFLWELAGNKPFFHLLRSAGSTLAVLASEASEQVSESLVQCFMYAPIAFLLPGSEA